MVKKLILYSLFVSAFFIVPSSMAQPYRDEQMEQLMLQKCGNAAAPNDEGKMCCTANVKSLFEKQMDGADAIIPSGILGIIKAAIGVALPIFDDNPSVKILTRPCYNGIPEGTGTSCKCVNYAPTATSSAEIARLCEVAINPASADNSDAEKKRIENDRNACIRCAANEGGFYSGFGCIPGNLADFISNFVLRIGIGIAGFISLMCIIYSSFLLQVSRGQPEMITKAREQITSCIIGLIMIIFSVFILRLIGVDILRIPGFS